MFSPKIRYISHTVDEALGKSVDQVTQCLSFSNLPLYLRFELGVGIYNLSLLVGIAFEPDHRQIISQPKDRIQAIG